MSKPSKTEQRQLRHTRIRRRVSGSADVPRMCVCCTSKHMYVQFVDDARGQTLAAVSSLDKSFREGPKRANAAGAAVLGKLAAEKALAAKISRVVFDRGGFRYHGRIKALADAARAAGLQF